MSTHASPETRKAPEPENSEASSAATLPDRGSNPKGVTAQVRYYHGAGEPGNPDKRYKDED